MTLCVVFCLAIGFELRLKEFSIGVTKAYISQAHIKVRHVGAIYLHLWHLWHIYTSIFVMITLNVYYVHSASANDFQELCLNSRNPSSCHSIAGSQ